MSPGGVQSLQKHHHPDVSKAAVVINTPLVPQEDDISELLEASTYQVGAAQRAGTLPQGLHHSFMFSTADGAGAEADGGEERPPGV